MSNSETMAQPFLYDLCSTLRMLEDAQATGVLTFFGKDGESRIVFDHGRVAAASSSRRNRLGQQLVASGQVSQALLETVLGLQRRKKHEALLGEILVSLGVITAAGLREVLKRQCISVLRGCMETGGTFDFRSEAVPSSDVTERFLLDDLIEGAQGGRR